MLRKMTLSSAGLISSSCSAVFSPATLKCSNQSRSGAYISRRKLIILSATWCIVAVVATINVHLVVQRQQQQKQHQKHEHTNTFANSQAQISTGIRYRKECNTSIARISTTGTNIAQVLR